MTDAVWAEEMVRMKFGPNDGIEFSPDGALLAVCSAHHDSAVYGVAFSPDGTRIATASRDETARVWNAVSGAALATMTGHFEGAQDVAFSPDGSLLATVSGDATARMWNAATGAHLVTPATPTTPASRPITGAT